MADHVDNRIIKVLNFIFKNRQKKRNFVIYMILIMVCIIQATMTIDQK